MIVFDLECINGHAFEGWFGDSGDFETQVEQGQLLCPVCNTDSVTRKLSPIAVRTGSSVSYDNANARMDVLAELNAKLTDYVEKNFENVGSDFAKEALKMHYGVKEHQNIRGTTTAEEDKVLDKEGVPVFKFNLPGKDDDTGLN